MTSEKIVSKIALLKSSKKKVFTNSHIIFSKFPQAEWDVWESEKTIMIVISDCHIKRIIFFTIEFEDLKRGLKSLAGEAVIEVVSKDKLSMEKEIKGLGFERYVTQIRVSCKDISGVFSSKSSVLKYYNKSIGTTAEDSDCEQINDMLWSTFDNRSSHLQSKTELLESIRRNEFWVHKNEKQKIEMVMQCSFFSKCFYFNQVINMGDRCLFHALVLNILKKYYDQGGRYAYAWVNEGNMASIKFFEKYTLVEDGLYNSIYYMNKSF